MMKQNSGDIDRGLRIALGVVGIGAGIYFQSYWGAIALVPLLTGLIGWCPAYLPLGLSTCRVKSSGNNAI